MHQNFLKECPSGKLTQKDFVKLFKEVHPSENKKEKADKFCQYVFKVIDKENQGFISFQDFVLCFALTSDGDFKEKCEFAFKLYDLDKDGKISKKEMTQVLTALYDLSGIESRKGDNAPEKKVNDIIKKINLTYQPAAPAAEAAQPETSAAAAASPAPDAKKDKKEKEKEKKEKKEKSPEKEKKEKSPEKEKKEKEKKEKEDKKEKPAKEKKEKPVKEKAPKKEKAAKVPEFITKEQFIDACSTDEQLKKLFVDSIFANSGKTDIDAMINDNSPVTISVNTSVTENGASSTRYTKTVTVPTITAPKISLNSSKLDRAANEEPIVHDSASSKPEVTTVITTTTINEEVTKTITKLNNELENLTNNLNSDINITTDETKLVNVTVTSNAEEKPNSEEAAPSAEASAPETAKEEKKENDDSESKEETKQ